MTKTAAPALRVLGCNDDQTTCDACGKVELRKTVILCDDKGTETGRYGTSCAARKLGYRTLTAQTVTVIELARRQDVASDIRAARKAVADGRLDWAAMYARDARRRGVHRPDELAALAEIDTAVGGAA